MSEVTIRCFVTLFHNISNYQIAYRGRTQTEDPRFRFKVPISSDLNDVALAVNLDISKKELKLVPWYYHSSSTIKIELNYYHCFTTIASYHQW